MSYKAVQKRAVVTGAASGLGRAICLELARRGWSIGVVDIDDRGAERTLELVEQAGGKGEVFHADVGRPEDVEAMAGHFFDTWGGVDLLVNNAGVAVMGLAGDIPLDDWRWIIDTNLWGVIYGCHEFIPRMKAQGGGHIVNTASIAGIMSMAEWSPYNVTKSAVISLSETLRVELAPDNIGVTAVCPIYFKSNLTDEMRYTDPWQLEYLTTALTSARMSAETIAEKVVRAVERNKCYVVPQPSAKLLRLNKMLAPSTYHGLMRLLNRYGLLRPFVMRLSRWRLL